jgi:hypothetical protein
MADERSAGGGVGSRPVDIAGDSPELIAFALLRYLAQLEQQDDTITFDRAWMLDAYAECLEAVQGKRLRKAAATRARPSKSPSSSRKRG